MNKAVRKKVVRKIVKFIPYVLILVLAIAWIKERMKSDDLLRNPSFSNGTILKFSGDYKGAGGRITYIFEVEGKEYKNINAYPTLITSKGYLLEGKKFPVVFDRRDTNNNLMLITPNDFKGYRIPFPDSLDWVKGCLQSY